jgi:hypothetical protein
MNHNVTNVRIMSIGYDFGFRGKELDDKVRKWITLSVNDNMCRMCKNGFRGKVDLTENLKKNGKERLR